MIWDWKYAVRRYLYSMKLKGKLLLSYFILLLISLGVTFLFLSSFISNLISNHITFSASQSFAQTHSFLTYKLYKMINTSDVIAYDDRLNAILIKHSKNIDQYSDVEQLQDLNDLTSYLTSFQDNVDIFKVRLYVRSGLMYSHENINIFSMDELYDATWYDHLLQSRHRVSLFPSSMLALDEVNEQPLVSIGRSIKNRDNYTETIGLLRLDIQKEVIQDILIKSTVSPDSVTYLENADGIIIASSNPELVSKLYIDHPFDDEGTVEDSFTEASMNGEKIGYISRLIPDTDWRLVIVIPHSTITKETNKLKWMITVLMIVVATVAILLAYYISSTITKRVSLLMEKMREVQSGTLDNAIKVSGSDEIGELIKSYNYMIQRISTLVEEQFQTSQRLKAQSFRALQSQINPHFLYNTLDMINWLSHKHHVTEITEIVNALAKFYKLSLNRGDEMSTISEEIQHVEVYVKIQNMRFNDNIRLIVQVPDDLMRCSIPHITLQPIVENAILHGILEKETKSGSIWIECMLDDEQVHLTVRDNGVGMNKHKLLELQTENSEKHTKSYGLKNINQRIQLVYGKEYGLQYESIYGKGTAVRITIPYVV